MSYGPNPWHQTSWDARAAGNFIGGGAGCGLIVFAALSPARGMALTSLLLAGLALVALGLFSVSLELGRPLRAVRVLRNPHTSWMAREAWIAAFVFPVALAAALGVPELRWLAGLLALLFAYYQAHILHGARGIPAWRDRIVPSLLVVTGMTEGAGLFFATALWHGAGTLLLLALFGALVIARCTVWVAYRRRIAGAIARDAGAALDGAGRILMVAGTVVPLALIALVAAGASGAAGAVFAGVAGVAAALAGSYVKFVLVTRAGFNQGFALAHLPVRGVRS